MRSLLRSVQRPEVGVIEGGRILRFACKPIRGKGLKKILSKYPNLITRASFDQWDPHPPKTRLIISGPLAYLGLEEIVEEYDSSWKPKPWEWHNKNALEDRRKYTLLHLEVREVTIGPQRGALENNGLAEREKLINELKRYKLSPINVPSHKRR